MGPPRNKLTNTTLHSTASGAPFPLSTSDQAEGAMNLNDDDLLLFCLIEGEIESFPIGVKRSSWRNPKFTVGYLRLKKKIQEARKMVH